jgi:L-rhamnose-proton symport protein RhaT
LRLTGLALIVIGGIMEGLFALPMRFAPRWSWETFWGVGSLIALILVPWPLALLTVPSLLTVYSSAPTSAIWLAILFGAGWGFGGVFFGRGVSVLGISLGTSIIMGLIAISGSIVPLLLQHDVQMPATSRLTLAAGMIIMVVGLIVCARAGTMRVDKGARRLGSLSSNFSLGILYCVAAGVLSALVNFALIFGGPIASQAMARNIDQGTANNAVWAIVFTSNYIVNIGYCLIIASKRKTLHEIQTASRAVYWLLAGTMGLLWAGGIVVYGHGAALGGALGPIFGFPIMLITSIITGNLAGAICGEWRDQPSSAKLAMGWGLSCMLLAIVTLGYANYKPQ